MPDDWIVRKRMEMNLKRELRLELRKKIEDRELFSQHLNEENSGSGHGGSKEDSNHSS